ncbi:MAG: cyclase family protein [Deltaproteobacteria bacterium]|nr:cyclase family protein [Deltaproteobacteria bacterium]MBW2063794.1 cyclase family protein [Deltaproteobacteria bacterium]
MPAIVDLSHEIFEDMPSLIKGAPVKTWMLHTHDKPQIWDKGLPPTEWHQLQKDGKEPFMSHDTMMLLLSDHVGTHVDAPSHTCPRTKPHGETIDEIPLERLWMLDAVLLDMKYKKKHDPILVTDFEKAEEEAGVEVKPGTMVIVNTGNYVNFDKNPVEYIQMRIHLTQESADWLVSKKITAFGMDSVNFDTHGLPDVSEQRRMHSLTVVGHPVHETLLCQNGILHVEGLNLRDLEETGKTRFKFCALPLKIRGGSGSPVRAIAIVD